MRQDEQSVTRIAGLSVHAQVMCTLRVSLFMLQLVSCLSSLFMLSLSFLSWSFRGQFSGLGGILFAPPVGDSELRSLSPILSLFLHQIHLRLIPRIISPSRRR